MATMPGGVTGRFQIGRVLSRAFDVIGGNFGLCAGLALLVSGVPQTLFQWLILAPMMGAGGRPDPAMALNYFGFAGLLGLVNFVLGAFLSAALTRAAIEHLSGGRPTLAQSMATAIGAVLPVLVMSILIGIASGIGFLLLIVPGVILMLGWVVAVPVMVSERRGIVESMTRSRELTRGTRWALLGLYLLLLIGMWALQLVLALITNLVGGAGDGIGSGLIPALLAGVVAAIIATVTACVSAAAFIELREVKEGASVHELADVFA